MKRATCLLLILIGLSITPETADAGWPPTENDDLTLPENWPNDQGYVNQWNFHSFIPPANLAKVSDYEKQIGAGIHADRAWIETTGNPTVVIAVLDSGIRWNNIDLVNNHYLNRAELPVPSGCPDNAPASDPYDVNNDGKFNVQDYTTATGHDTPSADLICHTGLTDGNANGILDPQDLIMAYSDGLDDDNNGWIDDISGWDTFHDDNDPGDETNYGHGTGIAQDAAREGNNGIGDIGVCPDCMILNVRVGDSFVVDSNHFALGAIYAVDAGTTALASAIGSINATEATFEAIEYMWKHNVAYIASAADENSFHANLPGSLNHTIYVHANVYNSVDRDSADTFLAFNNCTNYGSNLLLSTPGRACSSEATGLTGGAVGLLYSAALKAKAQGVNLVAPWGQSFPTTDIRESRLLSGEEMKQLFLTTVDDIYDPADATDPEKYITYPGWEKRFGYGRTNVANAVDAILAGRIPPVVDVWGPEWFQVVDPSKTPTIDITGNISFRSELFESYDYVVEWAPGIEPVPEDWTTLASGQNETNPIEGKLAEWDVSSLTIDNPPMPEPDLNVNRYMVTVRVRVTLNSMDAGRDGTEGEIRRAFHIHKDETLKPGYPVKLKGSIESPVTLYDINDDGKMEAIVADSAGWLHVLDDQAQPLSGWPVKLEIIRDMDPNNPNNHRQSNGFVSGAVNPDIAPSVMNAVGIADLDGDGPDGLSIVVATLDGKVYAFDNQGNVRTGFPVAIDPANSQPTSKTTVVEEGIFGAPVLEDLDTDGDMEIIVGALDGHVYVWHHDASPLVGFPVLLSDGEEIRRIIQTPSVGDIDGDGYPEIVTGTNEDYDGFTKLYAINHDGTIVTGWPVSSISPPVLPYVGTGLPNSTVLADIDGDGLPEVGSSGIVQLPTFYDGDASLIGVMNNDKFGENTTSDDFPSFVTISSGSIGDLDNDGDKDIIWGTAGINYAGSFAFGGVRVDFDHQVSAWDIESSDYLKGFPQRVDDHQFFMNPTIADVSGDDKPEVLAGSGGYYIHAWDVDGNEASGFPKFTGGWIIGAPGIGDIDGDGKLDVAAATREGYLFVWGTAGDTDGRVDWANFHHDERNTGNAEVPLNFGIRADQISSGCCDAGGSGLTAVIISLGVLLLMGRRRQSC